MSVSPATINLIRQLEGERLNAYRDSAGRWTIGVGHTLGVYGGMQITEQQSAQFLIEDVAIAYNGVMNAINKPMSAHEKGAFVSLTFNIGVGAFATSTAARRFNKGDKDGAAKAILWFNKITVANGVKEVNRGLINRREAEVRYFEMNVSDASFPTSWYENAAGESDEPTITAKTSALGGAVLALFLAVSTAVVAFIDQIKGFIDGLF